MMIDAFQQFGMELNDEAVAQDAADSFPSIANGPLEINFTGCIIDYEATSTLMDAALHAIQQAQPPRELIAVFNINFHERLFLKWLFLGSALLELDKGTGTDTDIRQKVIIGMAKLGVLFRIRVIDPESSKEIRTLSYDE
jgi:hypothetical protein